MCTHNAQKYKTETLFYRNNVVVIINNYRKMLHTFFGNVNSMHMLHLITYTSEYDTGVCVFGSLFHHGFVDDALTQLIPFVHKTKLVNVL